MKSRTTAKAGGNAKRVSALDRVNRARWARDDMVEEMETAGSVVAMHGWTDPGEQAAISAVASAARGGPILDIGVGGGRTTVFLRLISDDYVALDYTEQMVDACRRNYPGVDVRLGDVRDLNGVADNHYQLVVFSYNGLDAISHEDRQRALAEMARVLAPGGMLLYSTMNKRGPCHSATPWHPAGEPTKYSWSRLRRLEHGAAALAIAPLRLPRSFRNFRRLRPLYVDEGNWGVACLEAFDFSLLVHYTTLAGARQELASAGLTLTTAFDAEYGRPLDLDSDPTHARYFHLIARKPDPANP